MNIQRYAIFPTIDLFNAWIAIVDNSMGYPKCNCKDMENHTEAHTLTYTQAYIHPVNKSVAAPIDEKCPAEALIQATTMSNDEIIKLGFFPQLKQLPKQK